MATQSNNFTRSNVNAATLQITDPGRSSFNLGHRNELSIPFGKIVPVSTKILLPSDTFTGSLKPNFHLEKIGTPSIGITRLDTHTFIVNFRRINKDLRTNLENGTNFFPNLSIYNLLDVNLGFLIGHPSVSARVISLYNSGNTFKDIARDLPQKASARITTIIDKYKSFGEYCYKLDEYIKLQDYFQHIYAQLGKLTLDSNDPRYLFTYGLPMFFKPFIGPSSLLDYLGYPCYSQYNTFSAVLNKIYNSPLNFSVNTFKEKFTKFLETHPALVQYVLSNSLTLAQYSYDITSKPFDSIFSELPIRAYYAVWYDYLRNWHIEERRKVLDPDNFTNSPVVPSISSTEINAENVHKFSAFLSLCVLRSRDYGTDFLTSIQTDDSFRHVYSPVFSAPDSNGGNYRASIIKFDSSASLTPDNINGIYLPDSTGALFNFPSDRTSSTHYPREVSFAQDLQTMRRSGMLEKWLARNYYYPDTYVGRLQARFGVRPSDYEVLVSQYIGGSESFISGQELVANMSTSESVVGSRSLKADVTTTDNFSGSVSDYSLLISVVSTVPIVTYDSYSPAAKITEFVDFPQPEFATDTRVEARVSDFLRGFSVEPFIGYMPRYYMFRVSPDESHGRYLTDYRTYNWLRDNYSMSQENFQFSLNPYSLRVNLPLNAFIGLKPWDDFAYGSCDVNLVVNRALPAAIEII